MVTVVSQQTPSPVDITITTKTKDFSLHHYPPVEFHPVLVDTAEAVGAFLHIDGHLVVEARLAQKLVIQGPKDGLLH